MKLILFDIDSTLLTDGGAATAAFNLAFREIFGVEPVSVDKHGKTDPNILAETAMSTVGREPTETEYGRLQTRYCELFPEFLEKTSAFSLMNGARKLCARLSLAPSCCLGLQTGNFEPCARVKMQKAGLCSFFRFGGFGSDCADRARLVRIAIERGIVTANTTHFDATVIVIGDSTHDIIAGNHNNAFTIGVTTGKDCRNDLFAAKAATVVSDLTESSGIYEILLGDGCTG